MLKKKDTTIFLIYTNLFASDKNCVNFFRFLDIEIRMGIGYNMIEEISAVRIQRLPLMEEDKA